MKGVVNPASSLVAAVYLYPPSEGGRAQPILPGFRCPCFTERSTRGSGYDAEIIAEGEPITPEERRTATFVFLSGKWAAEKFKSAGVFYLWEGRFIGEARVLEGQLAGGR